MRATALPCLRVGPHLPASAHTICCLLRRLTPAATPHLPAAALAAAAEAGKQLDIVRSPLDLRDLVTDVHCIIEAMVGKEVSHLGSRANRLGREGEGLGGTGTGIPAGDGR